MKNKDLKINFRYLSGNIACLSVDNVDGKSVHNDINNEEAIIIFNSLVGEKENCQTVKTLLKENQELKKQLENQVMSISCDGEHKVCEYYKQCYFKDIKQKEFIKYLEDCISELKKEGMNKFQNTLNLGIAEVTEEILSRYKEIIGSENNGN